MNAEENKSFITSNCTAEPCSGEIQEVGPGVLCHKNNSSLSVLDHKHSAIRCTVSCNSNKGYESDMGLMEELRYEADPLLWFNELFCLFFALLKGNCDIFASWAIILPQQQLVLKRKTIIFIPVNNLLLNETNFLQQAATYWNWFQLSFYLQTFRWRSSIWKRSSCSG